MEVSKDMADIKDNKPYIITIGTDNRPGGVEGEFHLQFKPDIMNVTFGEQEKIAKEFGGTMRVTDGQEWADFYHEADAVKFAEKVIGMNQEQELQARFDAFKAKHGEEPLYAEVTIRWKDDGTEQEDIIKLSDDIDERDDDKVFFNVTGLNDLKGLINPDNGEDFYIVDVQNITFQPKSLFLNDEKAMTVEQLQEKAVKLFGDNFEFDYWNETEAGTKIDRIDLGGMPDTISIDKLEIKDGQLSLYSNDIAGDVDLQSLDDIELLKVDVFLDDIKSYLNNQQHNKEQALVERYQFAGMGNGTQFWPDRGTLGAYQAYAFKDNKILVFKDADDSKGVLLSSLPHEEQEQLMDAIGTLLDKHIASKAAKQVIHDRIVIPSARSFTANQVEILNRYHQVVTPGTPANEAFSRLLDEVAQEPDVARKPEKWVTDTAKELDDLADGITREQGQGLKR